MGYECVTALGKIKEYLAGAAVVAFDFETSPLEKYRAEERAALDAHKAEITGVSFSVSEGSGIYVPFRHRAGKNIRKPEEVMEYLQAALFGNVEVIKIAHNLSFESMFLYALGMVVQAPVYDTIAAAQLTLKSGTAFRGLSDSGLKTLVPLLFGVELPDFRTVTDGRFFDELSPQDGETVRYACADSDYALRLYHLFNSWFDRYLPKHRFLVEHVESPTAVFCGIMRYNGLVLDQAAMEARQQETDGRIAEIREEIAFLIGDVNIGANASTSAFKNYLYKDLGLPVLKTTAKYQEAADDEAMILLADWCRENRPELTRLFELVQEYRRIGKIRSTYLDGYLRHVNQATGRIHPDLMPLGTETGRFSARNPNLQNMPRKGSDPVGIRRLFVAPPGCAVMELDYSQVELRVGAFYCRDGKMLETYRGGGDIHAQTTSVIYHIPVEQAADKNGADYKERRTIAKNCNFGVFYGLFPRGLQKTLKFKAGLDTPLSDCENIIANLKAGYPQLSRWQEATKRQAAARRYSETWLGRRRYLPGIVSEDWGKKSFAERCAMNTPIQGTAADIIKLAMGRIVAVLPEYPWIQPVLTVHDSLVFYVPEERVEEAGRLIKGLMEKQPFAEFDVPLVAEVAAGVNYGEMDNGRKDFVAGEALRQGMGWPVFWRKMDMAMKRNAEGYHDPTACDALSNVIREERKKAYRALVFICSPYAGDMEGNARRAREYCRFAVAQNCIPLAPHLYFPQFMEECDPEQRSLGIAFGLVLQGRCREVWVFGRRISRGMAVEIEKAKERNLRLRYFTEECEEVGTE